MIEEQLDNKNVAEEDCKQDICFVVKRNSLLSLLAVSSGVVDKRSLVPVLSNILLKVNGNVLFSTATNMDIVLNSKINIVSSTANCVIAVNFYLLHEIVRKIPEDCELFFVATNNLLKIKAFRCKFELNIVSSSQFPNIEDNDFDFTYEISLSLLCKMINKVQFAVSIDESRYSLNGIYLHFDKDNSINSAATDGHRVACVSYDYDGVAEDRFGGVIVPRKTIIEISKLIKESSDVKVKVSVKVNKIQFAFENHVLTSKLIEGVFPNYKAIIPSVEDRKMVVIDVSDLKNAIYRVVSVVEEKSKGVKLSFSSNSLVLYANSAGSGSACEHLSVNYDGEDFSIGFNSKYLLDVLQNIEDDKVVLYLKNATESVRFVDRKQEKVFYIVMPMRI